MARRLVLIPTDFVSIFLFAFCLKRIMSLNVVAVTKPRILGEGPHWDPDTENLYFVDDFGSSIHRYRPSENRETHCKIHESAPVSIVIPIRGSRNKFAVTIGKNLSVVTWDGESTEPESVEILATADEGESGKETNQFNDGKADHTGRLWIGTMGAIGADGSWTPELGSLYSYTKAEGLRKHVDKLSISNGLIWNKAQTKMFYIDSPTKKIDVFDFDGKAGKIGNRRTFFDVKPHVMDQEGGPDGMTADDDDNLWVAIFGTGAILNVNGTTGEFIRKIQLPLMNPTSVTFGGPNLDDLYVTSATFGLTEEDKAKYPASGCTLKITGLGVRGRKAFLPDL